METNGRKKRTNYTDQAKNKDTLNLLINILKTNRFQKVHQLQRFLNGWLHNNRMNEKTIFANKRRTFANEKITFGNKGSVFANEKEQK